MPIKPFVTISFLVLLGSPVNAQKMLRITYNEQPMCADSLKIHEGVLCQHAMKIKYQRNGKMVATITLSEPVMVAMAEREERWGFFQFPSLGRVSDGSLRLTWQMAADSHKAYGKGPEREILPYWSYDGGRTWKPEKRTADVRARRYNVCMSDGSFLQVYNPRSKDIHAYQQFPEPSASRGDTLFYKENRLPEDLRGVYFTYTDCEGKSKIIHSEIKDSGLLRYAIDGLMPLMWWGNIKEMSDGRLVAGVYPAYYLGGNGNVLNCGVSFYTSTDRGNIWKITGKIPPVKDGIADVIGSAGFTEPTFEILNDSTFICVLRSGSTAPMYKSFSTDRGRTWTSPEPFTPNGVNPGLMLLKNGVLVLVSGRPGVQLRFSLDGKGKEWTAPIEMVPFMRKDGSYCRDVSCGYVSMLETGKNSLLIVYSNFTTNNKEGKTRKSIWCREISVKK